MALAGDWYPPDVYHVYAPHFQFGEAPPPVAAGVPYGTDTMVGTDVFVVPVDSPHPLQAAELAVFLDQPSAALLWDKLESNMPPVKALAYNPAFLKEVPWEWPSVMAAKADHLIPYPNTPVWGGSLSATDEVNLEEALMLNKTTPASAAHEFQSDALSAGS